MRRQHATSADSDQVKFDAILGGRIPPKTFVINASAVNINFGASDLPLLPSELDITVTMACISGNLVLECCW